MKARVLALRLRARVHVRTLDACLAGGVILLAAGTWSYAAFSLADANTSGDGPIRSVEDIPADLQEVLQQAPAPTHDQPTEWGLLLINPVVGGEAVINVQELPLPRLNGPDVRRGEAEGESALETLAAQGLPLIDVPEAYRKGMEVGLVASISDGERFWTVANFFGAVGTPDVISLQVEAYTPTGPVPFEEFPDNAIRDFAKSNAVRGHPTITVFPDQGTSNPRNERIVAWSQGGRVYFLRTTGLYLDAEILALANHISQAEESR